MAAVGNIGGSDNMVVGNIFDFSAYTSVTGFNIKMPNFTVNGVGDVISSSVKTAKLNLAGIATSCAAQPTGTVAVIAAVFTLCP